MESVCFWGEPLEVWVPLRYAPPMEPSPLPSCVDQCRVVLQGISPLIWRRLLSRSDMSLATLHVALQIVFAWRDEHLHAFGIHGKAYGCVRLSGPSFEDNLRHMPFSMLHLHRGLPLSIDFLADEKHSRCLTEKVYLPTIVRGRVTWHLGYVEGASTATFSGSDPTTGRPSYHLCSSILTKRAQPSALFSGMVRDVLAPLHIEDTNAQQMSSPHPFHEKRERAQKTL